MIDRTSPLKMANFSPSAQDIIRGSREPANRRRAVNIESRDLLAAIANSTTPAGQVLRQHGITYGEVMSCLGYYRGKGQLDSPFNELAFETNFTSDAKGVLGDAIFLAALREDSSTTTEVDLIHGLLNPNQGRGSYRLAKDQLHINTGAVLSSINALTRSKNQAVVATANS